MIVNHLTLYDFSVLFSESDPDVGEGVMKVAIGWLKFFAKLSKVSVGRSALRKMIAAGFPPKRFLEKALAITKGVGLDSEVGAVMVTSRDVVCESKC